MPTLDTLRAVVLCVIGGALCQVLHTPLPWMIGPLLAMAAGKLCGLHLAPPRFGREVGQVIIATALGLYFTPAVVREVLAYAPLMLLAAALSILLGFGSGRFLARVTGTDHTTAYFASVPGGATEMAIVGERYGAAVERVALAQSVRILLVVLIMPAALTWSGARGVDPYQPALLTVSPPGLVLLLALAASAGAALDRARIPNGWMLGPLFASILLTGGGGELSAVPRPLVNAGQLLLGCALGARFERSFLLAAPRYVAGVIASVLLAVSIAVILAACFAWLSDIRLPTLLLALAPGGIAEMCITAEVLKLGVPLVTGFHVVRLVLLVFCAAPLYRLVLRLRP